MSSWWRNPTLLLLGPHCPPSGDGCSVKASGMGLYWSLIHTAQYGGASSSCFCRVLEVRGLFSGTCLRPGDHGFSSRLGPREPSFQRAPPPPWSFLPGPCQGEGLNPRFSWPHSSLSSSPSKGSPISVKTQPLPPNPTVTHALGIFNEAQNTGNQKIYSGHRDF